MVKKVFYIEKEKFLRSMVELSLRAKNIEIYTIENLDNNFYLIDDLKPDLVLFDLETCQKESLEVFEKLLSYSQKTKLVATGPLALKSTLDQRILGYLAKPVVATNFAEQILSFMNEVAN